MPREKLNRVKKTFNIDPKLFEGLQSLSEDTRIPQSKLMDEALEDLLRKYDKDYLVKKA